MAIGNLYYSSQRRNDLEMDSHVNNKNNPHGVTLSQLGGAAASHTHTKDEISNFPASLPNPNAFTISLNGTSQGDYNGSAAKSINITPAAIGAAGASHSHSSYDSHISNKSNPHGVTCAQIGAATSSHTHSNYSTATNVKNINNYGSIVEGYNCTYSGTGTLYGTHIEGDSCTFSGTNLNLGIHIEGYNSKFTGNSVQSYGTHVEGYHTNYISGDSNTYGSHVEGFCNTVSGNYGAHAEGDTTTASGNSSHAEGDTTTASGTSSHAEGWKTIASASRAHAEGCETTASAIDSHAEGWLTTASQQRAHAEGYKTVASNYNSHAEGYNTEASGSSSHAQGNSTTSSGTESFSCGRGTIADSWCSNAFGRYNKASGIENNTIRDVITIGNGTDDTARANTFRVTYTGTVYGASYNTSGADYAEYFEWLDQNRYNEDRVGYFVSLNGDKIEKANHNDYILGIVSGNPSIIGNGDEDWLGRWQKDEFDRYLYKEITEDIQNYDIDNDVEPIYTTYLAKIENPEYDSSKIYVERKDRPEWDAIGMLGKLAVRDDGTCEVNGFCTCKDGGIATASDYGYRVIERVSDNVVKIIFR